MTADPFETESRDRAIRRSTGRILIGAIAAGVVLLAAAVLLVAHPDSWGPDAWQLIVTGALVLLTVLGFASVHLPERPPRPVPNTPVEIGHVVDFSVQARAGNAPGQHHTLFVAVEDAAGELRYGWHDLPADRAAEIPVGTLVGFRRHPTTAREVSITVDHPLTTLAVAATAPDPDRATALLSEGRRVTAEVTGLTVLDAVDERRWNVEIALALPADRVGRAVCRLVAEQFALVEPGTAVPVVHREPSEDATVVDCVVVPPVLTAGRPPERRFTD